MSLLGLRIRLVIGTTTGGTGAHVKALAARLAHAGADVTVLGPASTEQLFGFAGVGASFVPVEISASPRASDVRRSMQLRPYLLGSDIVHAHGLRAAFLAGVAFRRQPPPLVVTLHNAVLTGGLRGRVLGGVERIVARRATVMLCVSSDLVRRTTSIGARDVRLAPVGANRLAPATRSAQAVRGELGLAAGQPMILAVARLAHQKGLDILLAAAASWQSRTDRPMLVIAGDGPDESSLRDQAAALGIDVLFLGRRADVPDLLAAADLVVLASRWEGSPLSAHEALLAGRPLVATEVGGVPDLVASPAGPVALLVPGEDPTALGEAVARVLDDAVLAQSLVVRGLRRAEEWPSAQQSIDSVLELYQDLMAAVP